MMDTESDNLAPETDNDKTALTFIAGVLARAAVAYIAFGLSATLFVTNSASNEIGKATGFFAVAFPVFLAIFASIDFAKFGFTIPMHSWTTVCLGIVGCMTAYYYYSGKDVASAFPGVLVLMAFVAIPVSFGAYIGWLSRRVATKLFDKK